jgi:hypothetical protein
VPKIPDFLRNRLLSLNFMRLSSKKRRTRCRIESCEMWQIRISTSDNCYAI